MLEMGEFSIQSRPVNNPLSSYRWTLSPNATLYRSRCDKLLIFVLLTRTTHLDRRPFLFLLRSHSKTMGNWKVS
jgi:hypothetical protein